MDMLQGWGGRGRGGDIKSITGETAALYSIMVRSSAVC
jgi:hypothetical protein